MGREDKILRHLEERKLVRVKFSDYFEKDTKNLWTWRFGFPDKNGILTISEDCIDERISTKDYLALKKYFGVGMYKSLVERGELNENSEILIGDGNIGRGLQPRIYLNENNFPLDSETIRIRVKRKLETDKLESLDYRAKDFLDDVSWWVRQY